MKPFYYLYDFPERRNVSKNYLAPYPKYGKKHLSISRETGFYHCFHVGRGFHGRPEDFWEERPLSAGRAYGGPPASFPTSAGGKNGSAALAGNIGGGETFVSEISMIPDDYKHLSPDVLVGIKPLTDEPKTAGPDQLAARRYLADQGISLKMAVSAHLGCLTHRCFGGKGGKGGKNAAGTMYHCIAYVDYVNGQPVNVRYHSCDPPSSGYTKYWSQDSPTMPCPPYNIDYINSLRIFEESVARLIVTEGGRDVLTLYKVGYPYVISVPNGVAGGLRKNFEAFVPWLDQVHELVICGDRDLPGRVLVKHLADYFGPRCLLTALPGGRKGISDVPVAYGSGVVRKVVDFVHPRHTADIITVSEQTDEVLSVLHGEYGHGYDVGYDPLTGQVFHSIDQGGLIIVTGKPNSGKTDFLNDLTCHLIARTGRYVYFLSSEVPDKNKHITCLIRLMLGKVNMTAYTREQLQPIVFFLNARMVYPGLYEVSPTSTNIVECAEQVKRAVPLKYFIIDPYLFMEMESGHYNTEAQAIKTMLTQMQAWGRSNGIWVVIMAHPRSLKKQSGRDELEEIDMYTISGSTNWANLVDFIFSISHINQPDRNYTRLDMLKVRDQDLCRMGSMLFVRRPYGRYDERESEQQVMVEMQDKVLDKNRLPWAELLKEEEG